MEDAVEHPVGDERRGVALLLEVEAVAAYLVGCHGEGRRELTEQTVDGLDGYLPDAEETQDVVDAVGVEVFGHIAEAAYPPLAAVLEHLIPVVGGEAPVLTVDREGVGRCTSLTVEVEVARLHPDVAAVAAHADGDIALEDDVVLTGVLMGVGHLLIEDELYEIPEGDVLVGLRPTVGQFLAVGLIPDAVVGPLREVGCAVLVAKRAELGVRHEPVLVLLEELAVGVGAKRLGAFLFVKRLEVGELSVVDALVVNLRQGIELTALLLELLPQFGVLQFGQCAEVGILRMEGEDADAAIGIGVGPSVGGGGVVDGQHLQHMLTSEGDVVDEALHVAEVAHAERVFAAQGENRHKGAGHAGVVDGEESLVEVVDHHFAAVEDGQLDGAVVAALPDDILAVVVADGHELKLHHAVGEHVGVKVDDPFVVAMLRHRQTLAGIPVAKLLAFADDGQPMACSQLRGAHHEAYGVGEGRRREHLVLAREQTVGKG